MDRIIQPLQGVTALNVYILWGSIMPTELSGMAHGKLNLTLEVIGRREDGFHEIRSLIQAISIHDVIGVKEAMGLSISCDLLNVPASQNIAYKAAELMRNRYQIESGAEISIEKGIPISAGLGGGSSDAAMVLKLLNKMWALDLPLSDLVELASELGSDVPFFLSADTGLVEGKGEIVRRIYTDKSYNFVLLVPAVRLKCKTASMYKLLNDSNFTNGALTRKLEARIRNGGDIPPQFLFNVFDDVLPNMVPTIKECLAIFRSVGATEIHVAGSGPTLFTMVSTRELGTAISLVLKHKYKLNSFLVTSVNKVTK